MITEKDLLERAKKIQEQAISDRKSKEYWDKRIAKKKWDAIMAKVNQQKEEEEHLMDKWQPAIDRAKEHLEDEARKEQALIDSLLNNNSQNKR